MELQKFKELCKAVANKMEYEFVEKETQCSNNFAIKKDDSHIYLYEPYTNCAVAKLIVSGEYTRNCKGEYFPPKHCEQIKISLDKSPDQIVKNIKRRFMPKHLENLAGIKEKIKLANDYYIRKDNLFKGLIDYTKVLPTEHKNYTIYQYRDSEFREFIASSDTVFSIRLDGITLEKAKQIWDIIK